MSVASSTSPAPAPSPWPAVSAPPAAAASPPGADAWPSTAPCAPAVPPPHAIPACGRLQAAKVEDDEFKKKKKCISLSNGSCYWCVLVRQHC